LYNLIP